MGKARACMTPRAPLACCMGRGVPAGNQQRRFTRAAARCSEGRGGACLLQVPDLAGAGAALAVHLHVQAE